MAIQFKRQYGSITIKFNGITKNVDYGFSETYFFDAFTNSAAGKALGNVLANLRARFLPFDHKIVDVTGRLIPKSRKTFACINEPLSGTYLPKAQRKIFGNETVSLANLTVGNGTSGITPVVVSDLDDEFSVEHCDIASFFRLEGEDDSHVNRVFHGIPGIYVGDNAGEGIPTGFEWMASPPATVTTANPAVPQYWENYKDFLNYVGKNCVLVKKNPDYSPTASESSDNSKPFITVGIRSAIFKKIDASPVGKPFGLEVGRRLN